jgi:hypothetical protein
MNQEEIESWIGKGFLQVRIIFELLGKPKEHVEKTMSDYINKITETPHIKVITKTVAEAKEQEIENPQDNTQKETMYTAFAEIEFMIKGVSNLIGFCFDYMPASIEVLAPTRIAFTNNTVTDFINDLQTKLHKMDNVLKQKDSELNFIKKNLHMTILNLITLALHKRPQTLEELSQIFTNLNKISYNTDLKKQRYPK